MHDLCLNRLTVHRAGNALFDPITLRVGAGTVAALMGPSGVGKSSLIVHIAGLLPSGLIGSGQITLGNEELTTLPSEQRRVGLLFQDALLFPHLSVAENLGFALPSRIARKERDRRIREALHEIGLIGYGARDPAELSGGQRARVALQRVLLSEPRCLLLDEPFSKLDQDLRIRFRNDVFQHVQMRKLPCLLVSHDPADATHPAVETRISLTSPTETRDTQ